MTLAILLDLDGTIIDSKPGIQASAVAALRALGHEPAADFDISPYIGPPLEDMMHVLLKPYHDDRVAEAAAAYRQHYGESGLFASALYPGITHALTDLQANGAQLYLATSKRVTFATRILAHLNLAAHFTAIHGSTPDGALDHKLELVAHIIAKHGLSSAHSLMVGDRRHDIDGAHANAMPALGVLWGYGSRAELETAGADYLVNSPADLAHAAHAMRR